MAGRRHGWEEIAAKLAQAKELAARGKNQREISQALGVSIMTYHRWRKENGAHSLAATAGDKSSSRSMFDDDAEVSVQQLELENARLRRLVTDLLLEKVKLEEEISARTEKKARRSR